MSSNNVLSFRHSPTFVYGTIAEIRRVPHQLGFSHTGFHQELSRAFVTFTNLESFAWLCSTNPSLLVLLKHLGSCHRLRDVQIRGPYLGMSQANLLTDIKVLSALTLKEPSIGLMRVLCNWVDYIGENLTSLTLEVCIALRIAASTSGIDALNSLEIAGFRCTYTRESPTQTPQTTGVAY